MIMKYTIIADLWIFHGKAAWFFITLPKEESQQIKFFSSHTKRGWGAVRVTATIGSTTWNTSIFPYSKTESYILPIKAVVRKKEKIEVGDKITVELEIAV